MKRRTTARSSSLFLMELIIAILFFSVAASICVQFFVKARLMSQEAAQLDAAVADCTSAAEAILAGEDEDAVFANLTAVYPDAEFSDTFSARLTPYLTVTFRREGSLLTADLCYQLPDNEEPVYTLAVCKYLSGGES